MTHASTLQGVLQRGKQRSKIIARSALPKSPARRWFDAAAVGHLRSERTRPTGQTRVKTQVELDRAQKFIGLSAVHRQRHQDMTRVGKYAWRAP